MASNPVPRGSAYDFGIYRKWNGHDPHALDRGRRERLGIPPLCARCARGIHAYRHGDAGCMQILGGAPFDYVCRCALSRTPRTRAILTRLRAISRSSDPTCSPAGSPE